MTLRLCRSAGTREKDSGAGTRRPRRSNVPRSRSDRQSRQAGIHSRPAV